MDNMTQIAALGWAAKQRGIGYGVLECRLTPKEREEIFRAYLRHRREEQARLMKRRSAAAAREAEHAPRSGKSLELPDPPRKKGNGGRRFSFNTAAARALYDEGYNDCRIADELGMSVGAIRNWRCRQGLPPRANRGKPRVTPMG